MNAEQAIELLKKHNKSGGEKYLAIAALITTQQEEVARLTTESEKDYKDMRRFQGLYIAANSARETAESALAESEAGASVMREAIQCVVKTFRGDIEQGYKTRDKAFAIDILQNLALDATTAGASLLAKLAAYEKALEQLARLGNEPNYGNSVGNGIAQDALRKGRGGREG